MSYRAERDCIKSQGHISRGASGWVGKWICQGTLVIKHVFNLILLKVAEMACCHLALALLFYNTSLISYNPITCSGYSYLPWDNIRKLMFCLHHILLTFTLPPAMQGSDSLGGPPTNSRPGRPHGPKPPGSRPVTPPPCLPDFQGTGSAAGAPRATRPFIFCFSISSSSYNSRWVEEP